MRVWHRGKHSGNPQRCWWRRSSPKRGRSPTKITTQLRYFVSICVAIRLHVSICAAIRRHLCSNMVVRVCRGRRSGIRRRCWWRRNSRKRRSARPSSNPSASQAAPPPHLTRPTTPTLQGYLTYDKTQSPRTLPWACAGGPRGVGVFLWARYPCIGIVQLYDPRGSRKRRSARPSSKPSASQASPDSSL